MQENKDPAIKLFGRKIPLQGEGDDPTISGDDSASPVAIDVDNAGEDEGGQRSSEEEQDEADEESPAGKVTEKETEPPSEVNVNPKTPSIDEGTAKSSKNDDGTTNSQEKPLKKPDKVLPCPRCNSMDTKFCYYNNYNINQPRYFCKSCQRYWTDGGTMRNVPVGAGRRKSKNSSSHYRHITISEALQAARIDAPNGTWDRTNGKVLSFGFDSHSPICDSMASVLNLAEKNGVSKSSPNGVHSFEDQKTTSSMEESGKHTVQIPCFPCVPWPYPPGFPPLPFYHPAAFWNYGVAGNWNVNMNVNVPWFSPTTLESPRSGSNSPTLGKRSREGDMEKQRNGSVLVPKTLRIDDPSEAAKSSIWTTLGIKNESMSKGGMFEAFQTKEEEKHQRHHGTETSSSVLRANPAALSRSLNFHETT